MNADKPVGEGESAGASSADFAAVDAIGDECVPFLATFSALFYLFLCEFAGSNLEHPRCKRCRGFDKDACLRGS